jgi:NitT/TauT family transport system substrate-binding protein
MSLNQGETPAAVHFAQVNEMDGFFLTGREADPAFTWTKLQGAEVVMFKGGQQLAMFKYACYRALRASLCRATGNGLRLGSRAVL